ncbi:MAG: serine/threonine protein kinase, partial [Myxococcales bacterium]|nr:serine/threonine protein kinase [Myxococcales bacterium]
TYWIAMEYLHGEPLREMMRRCEERQHFMSPDIAARMCADAAEGLHAAHELRGKNNQLLGLVHRDVTPHNLFITYEGYTKVVDFGIAKVADRLSETRAGTLKGKLAYMSPEQVRGQDDVDRTTDVFALGVVLWELTTGHRLFRMDTDLDTLEKVQACVVPPPSTIVQGYPIELESVVMKALAKRKPDRYATAREFSRALNMYLQRRGVLIGPEEVSQFVRELFADRIKAREAHLAWAADVTGTINIEQLNAMKATRDAQGRDGGAKPREDSLKSMSDSSDEGPATLAVSAADMGRPSVPGPPTLAMRPSQGGRGGPMVQTGPMPPQPPAGGYAAAAVAPQNQSPNGPPRAPTPPAPPTVPHSPQAKGLASSSLVDDDEDIPTTVATREQVKDLAVISRPGSRPPGPPPARPGQNPQGDRSSLASIRSTSMGLGLAVPPPGSFGAPPAPPPPNGTTPPPPTFGAPPSQHPQGRTVNMAPGSNPGFFGPGFQGGNQGSQPQPNSMPAFGPPPSMSQPISSGPFQPLGSMQPMGMQQQQQQQGFGPPGGYNQMPGQGYGPNGEPPPGAGPPVNISQLPQRPPSQVETALSLPRPDPVQMWSAAGQATRNGESMSTLVLVAVAVLTAICVLALGALIYFKSRVG